MTVVSITPRMDLAHLAEIACCDRAEAAFVLLELIAEGHWAKSLEHLDHNEIAHALSRACARMDALEIPCE
jgi:hypothetical protein